MYLTVCLVPSHRICSRNLYAFTYLRKHPSTTTGEFNDIYKQLDAATLEVSFISHHPDRDLVSSGYNRMCFQRSTARCKYNQVVLTSIANRHVQVEIRTRTRGAGITRRHRCCLLCSSRGRTTGMWSDKPIFVLLGYLQLTCLITGVSERNEDKRAVHRCRQGQG